jgi:hypothetical protein
MKNKADTFNASEDKSTGKTYHGPQLSSYGNIREMTQVVGNTGMMDAGTGSSKTQP